MFHLLPFLLGAFGANKSDDIRTMRFKQFRQCCHMGGSTGEDDGRATFFQCFNNILDDEKVAIFVFCYLFCNLSKREVFITDKSEGSKTRNQQTLEGLSLHLCLCICAVSDRPTLHKDDRLMSILPNRCCRQSIDILGIDGFQNLFKVYRWDMMALIGNDHSIVFDKRLYLIIRNTRLHQCDVDDAMQFVSRWRKCANGRKTFLSSALTLFNFWNLIDNQELLQPLNPLVEQCLGMYKYQRVDTMLGYQSDGGNRFTKSRCRWKNTSIAGGQSLDSLLLVFAQLSIEMYGNTLAMICFIIKTKCYTFFFKECDNCILAPTR